MTKFVTYDQLAELTEAIGRIERAQATQRKPSALQALIAQSGVDGRITLGDLVTGAFAIVLVTLSGLAVGSGADIVFSLLSKPLPGPQLGTAAGMIIGGFAVGRRTVRDIWTMPEPELIEQAEPLPAFGLKVDVMSRTGPSSGTLLRGLLMPEVPRERAAEMAREAARLMFGSKRLMFSKRGGGKPFGDFLPQVQEEMLRLGLLKAAGSGKNAGYALTPSGWEWLGRFK